jgi:hypothetical protein
LDCAWRAIGAVCRHVAHVTISGEFVMGNPFMRVALFLSLALSSNPVLGGMGRNRS